MSRIKVLVVDDSALMRRMLTRMLESDPEIEVVGTALDGLFALRKINNLRPDVITLDVNMPRMDGMETLRHIVDDFGIPTIMVSSLTREDADMTLQALETGAFDFMPKPQGAISVRINEISDGLIGKVKAAYSNPSARFRIKRTEGRPAPKRDIPLSAAKTTDRILAIGVSTGGPNALSYLLPQIPEDFPAGIVIAQHMPAGFTGMFAQRLNYSSPIHVKEACDGDLVLPGRALIAPGDMNMRVRNMPFGTIAMISKSAVTGGYRPSADVLFHSVAAEYGEKAAGLIMTGMGSDGADGMGEIKARGGFTVAQDEESCVVFGMPREAIVRNNVMHVVSLEDLGRFLTSHFMGKEAKHETAGC